MRYIHEGNQRIRGLEVAMDNESLRVLVPIATFILGSLFTLLLKSREQRRDATHKAAAELVRLTKEWYTQIHQLLLEHSLLPEETSRIFFDYVHNRLILPDLMLQLEILRGRAPNSDLIPAVEKFLEAVTNYREAKERGDRISCPLSDAIFLKRSIDEEAELYLRELDQSLQVITRKAARVLS